MLDDDDKLDVTPEEGKDDRELDISSSDELAAMEDFTFSELAGEALDESDTPKQTAPEDDAMAIFDEFMASEDIPEAPAPQERQAEQEFNEELFSDTFAEDLDAVSEQQHPEPDSLLDESILGYNENNTATEILEERAAQEPVYEAPVAPPPPSEETAVFETDAFDDINSQQLFDYDPNAEVNASSSDDIFANIDTDEASDMTADPDEDFNQKPSGLGKRVGGGVSSMLHGLVGILPAKIRDFLPVKASEASVATPGGGGGSGGGGNDIAQFRRRRMVRMLSMVVLIMVVYSVLRSCTGGRTDVAMEDTVLDAGDTVAVVTESDEVPFDEASIVEPDEVTITEVEDDFTFPEMEETDMTIDIGEFTPVAPGTSLTSDITPEMAAQLEQLTSDIESATDQLAIDIEAAQELQNLGLMVPQAMSEMEVTLPTDPAALGATAGMVTQKLSDLEASLLAIDDRLDELNFQMRDERISRLETMLGSTSSPEAQAIVIQALQKMEDIDKKLARLNDLQSGMRTLDTEMRAIKADIEQQTMIVGEQQREINQSLAIARMQQDTPPQMMVQATIPGRAWLRSETGELLTVIPGDDIPGYGRVISIDAATGTVVMSSRVVFREQ